MSDGNEQIIRNKGHFFLFLNPTATASSEIFCEPKRGLTAKIWELRFSLVCLNYKALDYVSSIFRKMQKNKLTHQNVNTLYINKLRRCECI